MPSMESRMTDISATHVRAIGSNGPIGPIGPISVHLPTPHPPSILRNPRMISSLPTVFATADAAQRQFYLSNVPGRRVSRL